MKKLLLITALCSFNAFASIEIKSSSSGVGNQNQVVLRGYNGYGSTNTTILRWDSVDSGAGADFTVAQSVADGDSVTIGSNGYYCITLNGTAGGANAFGVSRNSSQLTTNIQSITTTDIVLYESQNSGYGLNGHRCMYLDSGDVIRGHAATTAFTDAGTFLSIVRVD